METETSSFETSEILAACLASSPLLSDSWRLCKAASTSARGGSVVEQAGNVCYVAFPALQEIPPSELGNLVVLESAADGPFSPLCRRYQGEEPAKVDGGMFNLFLSMLPNIQTQIRAAMERSKLIVVTGHSIGGAMASLSALWLLSYLQSFQASSFKVLCITFGSPLLGNESLSRAILRERWGGNFCHVASKHDLMPRLLFATLSPPIIPHIQTLLQFWNLSITSPQLANLFVLQFPDEHKAAVFSFVLACMENESARSELSPFGSYLFCSEEGAICIDNAASVTKMMHLMLTTASPTSSIEDHLKYGNYISKISSQLLRARSFMGRDLPRSSYDAGVALALESSGLSNQEAVVGQARECLDMARRIGRTPNLKAAELAIKLSQITPCRAEIQWYKERCDASDEKLGYYDFFKRGSMRRDNRVNMNRHKLAKFWDRVIEMLERNQLPCDFDRRLKWVNASQFYKLLVEPLDIADYYKNRKPDDKGHHYMKHGRPRRYEIFDRWWKNRNVTGEENYTRSRYASLTQDSCFWAKLEEARECLEDIRTEYDDNRRVLLWKKIIWFENYANGLVKKKEVSEDVVASNSSYSRWVAELARFKSQTLEIKSPVNW